MIVSEQFMPDDLELLLVLVNKVDLGNLSVISGSGDVYGYFRNDPEVVERRAHELALKSPNCRFELWAGEAFSGVIADTEESMVSFVKGLFFLSFVKLVGLTITEESVYRFIEDLDSKLPSKKEEEEFWRRFTSADSDD